MKSCSGIFEPGKTHFILGASGAGKSTLLNIITGRLNSQNDSGVSCKIKINNSVVLTKQSFAAHGAYIMQEDCLFEFMTVEEAITLSANLKLTLPHNEI